MKNRNANRVPPAWFFAGVVLSSLIGAGIAMTIAHNCKKQSVEHHRTKPWIDFEFTDPDPLANDTVWTPPLPEEE